MTQPTSPPAWANLFRVTDVSASDKSTDSCRTWHDYVLESSNSKILGRRFGTSEEVRIHANSRAEKLNGRLLGAGSRSIVIQKK